MRNPNGEGTGTRMSRKEPERLDCSWCDSVRSIEFGICQICLMEYPTESSVVELPRPTWDKKPKRVVPLEQNARATAE